MRTIILTLSLLLIGVTVTAASEICGNPCEEGYVWTDKDMGKCVPKPPQPTS